MSAAKSPQSLCVMISFVIQGIGDVYSWGWNESGQVGLPCMKGRCGENKVGTHDGCSMVLHPTLLFEDDVDVQVEHISCGSRHSAAITGRLACLT